MNYSLLPLYSGMLAWVLFRISIHVLEPTQTPARAEKRQRQGLPRSIPAEPPVYRVNESSSFVARQTLSRGESHRGQNGRQGGRRNHGLTTSRPSASSRSAGDLPTPKHLPKPTSLRELAEEASVLLELFSKIVPDYDDREAEKQKPLVDTALERILTIQKELRIRCARIGQEQALVAGETKVDTTCIVCYDQVADMVVMPCKHLALCMLCCDNMGIKEKDVLGQRRVQCPICRTIIFDRMKVFRG